jgi:hypothetical protein
MAAHGGGWSQVIPFSCAGSIPATARDNRLEKDAGLSIRMPEVQCTKGDGFSHD